MQCIGWSTYTTSESLVSEMLESMSSLNNILLFSLVGLGTEDSGEGGFIAQTPFSFNGFVLSWIKLVDGDPDLKFVMNGEGMSFHNNVPPFDPYFVDIVFL